MLSFIKSALISATALSLIVTASPVTPIPIEEAHRASLHSLTKRGDDECTNGPWQGILFIGAMGNSGSNSFCANRFVKNGVVARKLKAWADSDKVRALQMIFSDGSTSDIFGSTDSSSTKTAELDLDPGETITTCILNGNGKGTRLGRIYMQTSSGKTFEIKKDGSYGKGYTISTYSGLLLGMGGKYGADIDAAAFFFLRSKIASADMTDFKLDTPLDGEGYGIGTRTLREVVYTNNQASGTQTYTFSNWEKVTNTTSYSSGTSDNWATGVSVKAEIDFWIIKGDISSSFTWTHTKSTEQTTSSTVESDLNYSVSGEIPLNQSIKCVASAANGNTKSKYTANVKLTLEDGTTASYMDSGEMSTTAWTKAWATCSSA